MGCAAAVESILKQASRAKAFPIELRAGAIVLKVDSPQAGLDDFAAIVSTLDAANVTNVSIVPKAGIGVRIWSVSVNSFASHQKRSLEQYRWGNRPIGPREIRPRGSNHGQE